MLRPQGSTTRQLTCLDGLWRFALDPHGRGRADRWFAAALPGTGEMAVPASYNDVLVGPEGRDHVGEAWYQRTVDVPASWTGQRVVLHLEAATHRGTVWVGDVEVASHEGGYTPFEVDVTDHAAPGSRVLVTVSVDNRLTFQSIPPGQVVDTPAGPRQRYWHDFFNYSGLHRSVWLCVRPATWVEDLAIVTGLDGADGTVAWTVGIGSVPQHRSSVDVRVRLIDRDGVEVGRGEGGTGTVRVAGVHPWAPGDGYLYELVVDLVDVQDDDRVVDRYRQPVGVRTVEVRGTEFLINGAPFHFRGFGRHEDLSVLGKGHSDAAMLHDLGLLEWVGANSFRTAHYPHASAVLDYADRHGIVVIDETAAVGMNMRLAELVGKGTGLPTYSPDSIGDATREVHAQAIRELVARDRNHPSVVLWSIANEPESGTQAAVDYFRPLFDIARDADPTRPVGLVNMFLAPHGVCRLTDFADVVMINRYHGWYSHTGDLANAEPALAAELTAWAGDGKPIIVTEYGADALPGLHTLAPEPWSEEFQAELLAMSHRCFDACDAVVGEHVWSFADFATTADVGRVDGNRKGVFTRDRRPKAAAHLLRRRWHGADRGSADG